MDGTRERANMTLLDDIEQKIYVEYLATSDFISDGQIIRAGSWYQMGTDYPPSHYIEEVKDDK